MLFIVKTYFPLKILQHLFDSYAVANFVRVALGSVSDFAAGTVRIIN